MQLKTSSRTFGDALIISCEGRIIFGDETAFLRHQVKDLMGESKRMVLDLSRVSYVDSTGVGTLVGLYASASNAGCEIKLAGLTGRVKEVLQITKLATVFESYDSAEEAAASFVVGAGKTAAAEWAG